jgi:hypothetical protein
MSNPEYVNFDIQNTTFGGSLNYPQVGAWLVNGGNNSVILKLTNCIVANLTFLLNSGATLDGEHNGFYRTPNQFGASVIWTGDPPFQSKGEGNYYLRVANDGSDASLCRDVGTTAIDPTLAADLSKKTTFPAADPPTAPPPPAVVNWNITAARDTVSGDLPDLGYHYDPLDYWCSQYVLNGNPSIVNNGVAIGLYGSAGFSIQGSGGINATGAPDAMVRLVWYPSVQEQPVRFNNIGTYLSPLFSISSSVGAPKLITLRFTDLPMLGRRQAFFDTSDASYFPVVTLRDCWLRGVSIALSGTLQSRMPGPSILLQNDLCERSTISLFNGYSLGQGGAVYQNPLGFTAYNNLFWNSTLALTYRESQDQYKVAWTVTDNLLDSTTLSLTGDGSYLAHIFRSNNGFCNTTAGQLAGANDVPLTPPVNYASGPFGPWYIAFSNPTLQNVGSRGAPSAGLYHHTIQPSQAKEICTQVDIGFHYAAADSNGKPEDSNADGIPDCIQDSNGNGVVDGSEAAWAPSVSVSATDRDASENGNDPGTFTIMRTLENPNVPLTVNFQMTGTATPGIDYILLDPSGNQLGNQITIPPGNQSVNITLLPLTDSVVEGTEHAVLTLTCGENYVVGSPISDTIDITDGPPPVVTIQPADATACEDTGDPAAFAIMRTGGRLAAPLTVNFQVDATSTATEGVDYQSLQPHQVTFAVDANLTTVVVQPTGNLTWIGSKIVVLTLQSSPNYTVGTPSIATINILHTCNGDSTGTDFWITFFNANTPDAVQLSLMISAPFPTSGQVSIPGLGFNQAFSVTPGKVKSVIVPNTPGASALLTDYDIVQTKGIHVNADQPISVYGLNFEVLASEAFLAYPTPFLGTSYCLMARAGNTGDPNASSQFAIVAPQDQTTVYITPSQTANIEGHQGSPPPQFSVLLQQGQTYQLRSIDDTFDVTGTLLSSDKPIAVFAGARCANVPDQNTTFCNQLVEEQLPLNLWGNQALGVPLASRSNGDVYRVLAANNNTEILINGTLDPQVLNAGGSFDRTRTVPTEFLGRDSRDHISPQPIQVAQFSTGQFVGGNPGDPFEMLLPPAGKYLQAYTVSVPTGFDSSFFNLIVDQSALNDTFVDSQQVANFQQIGTSSYFGTQFPQPPLQPLQPGPHIISSSKPVGVQVYGFAFQDGYGYIGGVSR